MADDKKPANEAVLLVQGDGSNSSDGKLTINKRNLTNLLNSIENVPVSVVSIAGPPSNGKSLLFGYLVRYLIAAEQDEFDWMDWDNPEKSLTEFQWTNEGKSPKIPGIWAFPRPFMLEYGEGASKQKAAVLLLYTQLSQRNHWDNGDSDVTALLGLTLAISSTTVFNVYKHLDENCLSAIASAIKYSVEASGLLGGPLKKVKNPLLPLQNASFLIRDWNYPSDFAYGTSGGLTFLKTEKLKDFPAHSKQSRESRQLINGLFENISGCLLPFPGSEVINPDEFQGSIKEMDEKFANHLSDFISNLINIDDLLIKRNSQGISVTGKILKEMVEKYVSKIGEMEVSGLHARRILRKFKIKVTSDPAEQKEYIKPALKTYAETWRKYEKGRKFLDEKTLQAVQKKAKKKALETFQNEICPQDGDYDDDAGDSSDDGISTIDENVKRRLTERISKRFKEITTENLTKKKSFLEGCKADLIQQYGDSMATVFPLGGRKPTEVTFKRESKEVMANLKMEFSEKLDDIGTKETMNDDMDNFVGRLIEEEKKFYDKLFGIPKSDEGDDDAFEGDLQQFDRFSLRGSRNDGFRHQRRMDTSSIVSRSSGFSDVSSKDDLASLRDFQDDNSEEFEKPKVKRSDTMKKSKEQQRKENEVLKNKAKKLNEFLKSSHEKELEDYLETGADNDDLQKCHMDNMKDVLERYEDESPYPKDSPEFGAYQDILKDELKMAFNAAQSKLRRNKQKKEDNVTSTVKLALGEYETQLQEFIEDNEDLAENQLMKKHKEIKKEILDALVANVGLKPFSEISEQTEQKIEDIFDNYKSKATKSQSTSADKSLSMISKYKTEYTKKMKDVAISGTDEKALLEEHEKVVEDLVERFEKVSPAKTTPHVFKEHVSQLKKTLADAYSGAIEILGFRQKNEETSFKLAVREARLFYCAEMDKHKRNNEYAFKRDLDKLHAKTCAAALKKFPGLKQAELKETVKLAFQKYQDEVEMNKDKEPAIGIDLGTTYSCVSIYQKGKVEIIPNSVGKLTTPSYVLLQGKGREDIVGEPAKSRAYENPEGTIFDAKRILGRRFDDVKLQEDMKLWPFTVVDGGRGVPMIEVAGEKMNPEVISSKILKQLKKDAEKYLSRKVTKAVITVPAYFTDGQKQATIDAGEMAGLEVLSILTEPVAAAMAYKLQYSNEDDEGNDGRHILIFDLGGGTFDVAVLKTSQGKIEVLTVDGDTHLGGEDFDKNLMNYCAQEFKMVHKVDLFDGKDSPVKKIRDDVRRRLKRVQAECERQKIALATARSADINVDNIYNDLDLQVTVTKATFERINQNLFDTTIKVVASALGAAKLDKKRINDVVLVGGSTRIPKVQEMLQNYFGGKELDKKINPDEAVAHGAGLMAAIRRGNIETTSKAFTKIQDVTPMSIGVEIYGGGFSAIIPKSTKIPVMLKERYKTAHNNQTSVQITIYEGENRIAKENKHLGDFYLNGIPPKDAGVENIDVEMVINEQGILHVTAKCSSTGTKSTVTVTENKQRMGQAAKQRYLAEAN